MPVPVLFVLVLFFLQNIKTPLNESSGEIKQKFENSVLLKQIAMFFRVCPGIFIMAGTAGIKAERHEPAS